MKNLATITAKANEKTKTFDIVKVWSDGTFITYRTIKIAKQEFENMKYNTVNDWQNFLNTSKSYYRVQ